MALFLKGIGPIQGSPLVSMHAGKVGEVVVGTLDDDAGTHPREHISRAPRQRGTRYWMRCHSTINGRRAWVPMDRFRVPALTHRSRPAQPGPWPAVVRSNSTEKEEACVQLP
jgi:hypothetical protein